MCFIFQRCRGRIITRVSGKCCFIYTAAGFWSQVGDEVMRSVLPVYAAAMVEISDFVQWNVEIQHQPLFRLPTITTDATKRESGTDYGVRHPL